MSDKELLWLESTWKVTRRYSRRDKNESKMKAFAADRKTSENIMLYLELPLNTDQSDVSNLA